MAPPAGYRRPLTAVAAGGRRADSPAAHRFVLSEGDRQELEMRGVVNIGGKQRTREEVLAMLDDAQGAVEIRAAFPAEERDLGETVRDAPAVRLFGIGRH